MRAAAVRTICSCSELSSRYGTARSSGRSSHRPQARDRATRRNGPMRPPVEVWRGAASGGGLDAVGRSDRGQIGTTASPVRPWSWRTMMPTCVPRV